MSDKAGTTSLPENAAEEPEVFIVQAGGELKLPEIKILNRRKQGIVLRRWRNKNDHLPYLEIEGELHR